MLKILKQQIIAFKIEWHWLFIIPGRKKANRMINRLLERGQHPLNSTKLAAIYRCISRHCVKVSALTQIYNKLTGIQKLK